MIETRGADEVFETWLEGGFDLMFLAMKDDEEACEDAVQVPKHKGMHAPYTTPPLHAHVAFVAKHTDSVARDHCGRCQGSCCHTVW